MIEIKKYSTSLCGICIFFFFCLQSPGWFKAARHPRLSSASFFASVQFPHPTSRTTCFVYSSLRLPLQFLPTMAPSTTQRTNPLCLRICPIRLSLPPRDVSPQTWFFANSLHDLFIILSQQLPVTPLLTPPIIYLVPLLSSSTFIKCCTPGVYLQKHFSIAKFIFVITILFIERSLILPYSSYSFHPVLVYFPGSK